MIGFSLPGSDPVEPGTGVLTVLDVTGNIDEACILTEGFTISGLNAEAYEFLSLIHI